jgi:hypothetical protein
MFSTLPDRLAETDRLLIVMRAAHARTAEEYNTTMATIGVTYSQAVHDGYLMPDRTAADKLSRRAALEEVCRVYHQGCERARETRDAEEYRVTMEYQCAARFVGAENLNAPA